ncbi:MAG: pseudouridine synthase [Gammaproteobacteria bacterium]|jgi:23S rRNA pseudouridine2605 synthase
MSEKLQKVLARQGLGSRREIERWIADGRITVDKQVATVGDRVTGKEIIALDGKILRLKPPEQQPPRVIVYHKDAGTVCSRSDADGRRTVFEDFPNVRNGRWILVGRLDITTTGLLLATTDGELANRLMHPRYEIKREYAVRVYGEVTPDMLQQLQRGVELEDGMARFDSITAMGGEGRNQWFTVELREGRNREVRRLWESQGVQVNRLARNQFGPVRLPRRLPRGDWEELPKAQVEQLYAITGLPSPFVEQRQSAIGGKRTRGRKKKSTGRKKRA